MAAGGGRTPRARPSMRVGVDRARCRRSRPERDRAGHADGVGHLDLAPAGGAGGHHVLGHPAGRVGGRAVDLGRVLAREGAAAVAGHAAVGVDDDLATGEPGVGVGTAELEAPGGVGQDPERLEVSRSVGSSGWITCSRRSGSSSVSMSTPGCVLGRDQHRVDGDGPAVLVDRRSPGSCRRAAGRAARRPGAPGPGAGPAGGPARWAAA